MRVDAHSSPRLCPTTAECPTAAQLMQQCHSLACVVLNPFVPDVATCLSSGGSADEKRQLVAAIR